MSTRLLILDFDGVCTYSHDEILSKGIDVGTIENLIRPAVPDLVSAAQRAGVVVAVLSNDLPRSWIDDLDLLQNVDHVVLCSDNGILKPDRRAFQRCLLLTGSRAEHTVVVDDRRDNVTVAASLGMTAFHFDSEFTWSAAMGALGV